MKSSVYIAVSLDGYIAREDGAVDWLEGVESPGEGEYYGYYAFMDSIDCLVMGRKSYDKVASFGDWPYGDNRVVVLTNRPFDPPIDTVESMGGTPAEISEYLAADGAEHLYIDGRETITAFLEAGLIDEMIIIRLPILLGSGLPLFGRIGREIALRHVDTKSYRNGLTQSCYLVLNNAGSM
ncbi:MAG: dihydrofolate reductase family protein [Proteobacteria bacterium]|nr:dihydrofolate reductase family protein [Pseudomonadota bacterium]